MNDTTNMLAHINAIMDLMDRDPVIGMGSFECDVADDELDAMKNEARAKIITEYCEKNGLDREELQSFWIMKAEANG